MLWWKLIWGEVASRSEELPFGTKSVVLCTNPFFSDLS